MKVSVIIPTYNAEKYLPDLLENLTKQTLSFELIIIDSTSSDNTLNIAKKYTHNIITIPHHEFDHGGTRTKAAKVASGDIIIFLTQDALPKSHHTLATLLEVFDDSNIGAAFGRQLAYENTNIFGKHLRLFNYPEDAYVRSLKDSAQYGIKTSFLSDSFAAYRKNVLKEIGWFKNGLIVGEDNYAGAKILLAGYHLAYVANSKVCHSHSYSPIEEFQRYFDIGVFHTMEHWLLEKFGKAEGEGSRFVKSEFFYLLKEKMYFRIPEFFIRNALKYMGYKLGKNYQHFPFYWRKKLSMHTLWWTK